MAGKEIKTGRDHILKLYTKKDYPNLNALLQYEKKKSVYDAVEMIRERAGLNPYRLPEGLSKEEMRERIRHERYIELAFEQKRYWDLRRWKIAVEKLDGKYFHAMHITTNEDGSYTYNQKPVTQGPYVFQEKMYFMPIPQREIKKNPNLEQNPEW